MHNALSEIMCGFAQCWFSDLRTPLNYLIKNTNETMTTDLRNSVIYKSLQEENRSQTACTFTICISPLSHSNTILFLKILKSSHWFTFVQVTQNTLH